MKTISIPTNDRPDLLIRCLESIQRAKDHSSWVIVFTSEPNHKVADLIAQVRFCPIYFTRNPVKLGCRLNTFMAVVFAHALGSEFNLYLEDDIVISPDALIMAEQFRSLQRDGVLCLRRWHNSQIPQPHVVSPANHGLLGNGFAYHDSMFPTLAKYWFYDNPEAGGKMWDWTLDWGLINEGIRCWRPMVNRSKSIGIKGTHCESAADLNHFGAHYEGEPVQSFTFTP